MAGNERKTAGFLFLFAGAGIWLLITVCESYYPGYSVRTQAISDLGAVGSPTAGFFDLILLLLAIMWLIGVLKGFNRGRTLNLLPAIGLILAAISPENVNGFVHGLGALFIFVGGSIALIYDFLVLDSGYRYFSLLLGVLTGISTIVEVFYYMFPGAIYLLGYGGVERMIVYPLLIWAIGYGGNLLSRTAP